MARGDFVLFEEFALTLGHNTDDIWQLNASDSIRLGIVDETAPVPIAASATPTWDDFQGNEVGTGGTDYPANGYVLVTPTYTEAAGVATFNAADVTISQDGSGFTNGYWGILYNYTLGGASGLGMGFIDLDGPVSEVAGPIVITWHASGIFTVTITP